MIKENIDYLVEKLDEGYYEYVLDDMEVTMLITALKYYKEKNYE